jgi:hypothetical protein
MLNKDLTIFIRQIYTNSNIVIQMCQDMALGRGLLYTDVRSTIESPEIQVPALDIRLY